MKKKALIAMLLACSFAFGTATMTACDILGGDGGAGTGTEQGGGTTVAVTGITLNKDVLNLKIGGSETLTATVAPADATNRNVTWKSDKPDIASVDENGKVTAKAKGTAIITVTTVSGGKTDTCTVNVTENPPAPVNVESVSLSPSSKELKVGENFTLTPSFTPSNPDNKNVSWSASTDAVTVVNGLVTANKVGNAIVTVTTEDGGKTATCSVTVKPATTATVNVSGVSLNKTKATIKINQTLQLTKTITPANASNQAVTWSSDNETAATVDNNGLVTAKAEGNATITVRTADGGYTATCAVTVEKVPEPVVDAKITYNYAGNECAAFEWGDSNAAGAKVEYKLKSASSYAELTGDDKDYLVRQKDTTTARVDFVGLQGGAVYDFKITTSSGEELTASNVTVHSYDRSGYAHFKKTDGVGAYKDDGTPKSNAKIIYLTEDNKNNIDGKGNSIAQYLKSSAKNSAPIIIRVVGTVGSATWNLKDYGDKYGKESEGKTPLYASDVSKLTPRLDGGTEKLATSGEVTYYQDSTSYNGSSKTLDGIYNTLNLHPVREDGLYDDKECAAIKGLNSYMKVKKDVYDSCWNDCRVENVSNVTVEGIGDDAEIFQWGFTFKNSSSIEVRNIHFDDYTEDGCSFEGSEDTSTSLSGFKSGNIWLHHNTFDEGMNYWDVCDEQDKGDGDGSTDFKGLKNITIAYNHYIATHKTGLIGGSDSVATASVTFHHNYYEGCNQRMPLGRQANMHMYNNYYAGSTMYSISLRAGAYAFIENCVFTEGAKSKYPLELVKGSSGIPSAKIVNCDINENRISNGVDSAYLYVGTDRSHKMNNASTSSQTKQRFAPDFDTDSSLFYYDGTNKKSDVSVMFTAEETKEYIPKLAGVQKRGGDVTLGGSGSGSGSTGGGTETPDPTPTPDPEGTLKGSANVTGAKTANAVLLELKNGSATLAKATLVPSGTEKSGGTLVESDGTTSNAEGHIQVDAVGALKLELAEGYTYTVTIYTGSSSNTAEREITINDVKQTTGIGGNCKALSWNLSAGTYTSTENNKIRIAKIIITATPV